jgi:hypothetical protein
LREPTRDPPVHATPDMSLVGGAVVFDFVGGGTAVIISVGSSMTIKYVKMMCRGMGQRWCFFL